MAISPCARGEDRPWPFIQPRYENRSRYFYDSRGAGQLCMDEQITATALQNAELTLIDYYKEPMLKGTGSRSGTNISLEPGSFLPEDADFAQMPSIPQHFTFEVERHKRAASMRVGALGQHQYSGDLTSKKRVQKTAREVEEESVRGAMLSTASVDRFNMPFAELFQQLWDDLKRLRKPLPLIENNVNMGEASFAVYAMRVLLVPAANTKTLNPDQQFMRDRAAWEFAASALGPMGVLLDPNAAGRDILSNWDPEKATRWILDPNKPGPRGQQPVYAMLQQLMQQSQDVAEQVKQLVDLAQSVGRLAQENADRIDKIDQGEAGGERTGET